MADPLKIYISSTFSDLELQREAMSKALRKLRHYVIAMEDYVATDKHPLDKCLADVESSARRGSPDPVESIDHRSFLTLVARSGDRPQWLTREN